MEDKIKVTILVPIYKVEKYVSKCLNSLINQTFKDIQIIAINDGSPDNSEKIVRQFMTKDSRIKLINKKNGGYGFIEYPNDFILEKRFRFSCWR